MKSAKIIIATHKKYDMSEDEIYLPLQVGAKIAKDQAGRTKDLGYEKDSTGKNISEKNPTFCELTGLYWGWKNLKTDCYGLVHYRRHFTLKNGPLKSREARLKSILTTDELNSLTEKYDLILPKRRNYYIETLYSHYAHTLHVEPLDRTRDIIAKKYPEYLPEFDKLKTRRSAHMFNMMIGRKEILDKYCEWLFDILFTLEKELGKNLDYDQFHSRFYGRISELLFDVWLYTNYAKNELKIKELRVVEIDGSHLVKRATHFLAAKFADKKYDKSF